MQARCSEFESRWLHEKILDSYLCRIGYHKLINELLVKQRMVIMIVSEKRLVANKRNLELARIKLKEVLHRIKARNDELVECVAICEHCHNEFRKMIKRIDFDNNRLPRFCSRSCANSRVKTDADRAKLSAKLLNKRYVNGKCVEIKPVCCKCCGVVIPYALRTHRTFCSLECKKRYSQHMESGNFSGSYRQYRRACMFKFALSSYPEEFNFKLIEQYGWYSPKNKKNNPNGVTRDHMFSVKLGYENNVSPYLLSHPANCMLMLHLDNVSKGKKCSITLDELKTRISEWELKYGKYECK